jgi:hypothetical protein
MSNAIGLLERERKEAEDKFYKYSKRVREGESKMKEHRDFYRNAEIVISRLIELLKKEGESNG